VDRARRLLGEPGARVAMAGSPGSGPSLEGISLGSSEEAELRREGRERWDGEAAGGVLRPLTDSPAAGFGALGKDAPPSHVLGA
jgi:hypothetical protein